ncbi:MAG: hypothetical protein ABIG63_16180 [Chloroflexota bacterium]
MFLTKLSGELETISQASDDIGIILEKLWAIGAGEKLERSRSKRDNANV